MFGIEVLFFFFSLGGGGVWRGSCDCEIIVDSV